MQTVELQQNNSGGSFWLNQEQFDALLADGWRISEQSREWRTSFAGVTSCDLELDVPVDDPHHAETIAKIEFQRVTGEDPDAIGCTCCGPPFYFSAR